MRRERALGAAVILLLALLAGCTTPADEAGREDSVARAGRDDVEIRAELPMWRIGQGWRHVVDVPGVRTERITMMVAEDHGDLFVVATDDPQLALHHAIYPTTPVLGRNGKETLAPFQGGAPARMYEFPLEDEKRWSAEFFGETMQFVAFYVGDIELAPRLGLGEFAQGFRVTATGASGTRVLYDYVDAVQWFTRFEVIDPDGVRLIRLDLEEIIPAHRGPYHFLRGEHLLVERLTAVPLEPLYLEIPVPPPERFFDGLAIGVRYVGHPGVVPSLLNLTVVGPPGEPLGDTRYLEREFTGLGQTFMRLDLQVPPACLDPAEGACSGAFSVRALLVGAADVELRIASYEIFAEGTL